EYLERAVRGGFPEAVRRANPGRRAKWFEAYVTTLVQRDIAELAEIERLAELPRVLRLVAARTAGVLNVDGLARDVSVPPSTLRRYLVLLETAFVVERVPAWATSRTTRAVHAPKLFVSDSGLAAHLLGATAARLSRPGQDAGPVLETFVAMELRRQLGWSEERATLHHFRTRDGVEVDIVLETPDGRVAGVEVKAGSTVRGEDFRGLRQLRARAGESFVAGVVLYTGPTSLPFGDGLWAVPLSTLWEL
ncbi:MAG: ATP-binding protein, partial [Acidimicrobiales bacterium]